MKKLKLFILLTVLFSSFTYSQNNHFDAAKDILKALESLKSFSEKLNRNGWNNSYNYKTYNSLIQRTEKHIDNAYDKLDESISLIERIENTNYQCLRDDLKKKTGESTMSWLNRISNNKKSIDLINSLKKLKAKLKSYSKRINDLDNSKIASRLYTIYKYPKNKRYIKTASKEVSKYLKPTFNNLKNIYNSMVSSSRNYDYYKINVKTSQTKLSKICK
jgi:exonuclease VII large subunit